MSEKSSFFDSINKDRAYYAADFASHMADFFTNGIFNNGLKVEANDGMTILVNLGSANINGYKYKLDSNPKVLNIENADGILNRVDNIVIRLDIPNRQITTEIVKGSFAENAVPPILERGTSIYDLRIAKVYVPAGTTEIAEELIEDTRFNSNDCGNVVCAVNTPDFTDILTQYSELWERLLEVEATDFDEWFEGIKNKLSEDAAGNLQLQVDEIKEEINPANYEEIDSADEQNYLMIYNAQSKEYQKMTLGDLRTEFLKVENPVGKIRLQTIPTNPSEFLGFGTWEYWGAGRVPVSVDKTQLDFSEVEKEGGSKEHSHKYEVEFINSKNVTSAVGATNPNGNVNVRTNGNNLPLNTNSKLNDGGAWNYNDGVSKISQGETFNNSNLPPYITCYMYKRTA